jgi:phospholipase A1/A2
MKPTAFRNIPFSLILAVFLRAFCPCEVWAGATSEDSPPLPFLSAFDPDLLEKTDPENDEGGEGDRDGGVLRRVRGGFSLHRDNYLIPFTWSNSADSSSDAELQFQFSIKQQLYRGLAFAYTQKSFWRFLDQRNSRPFRETNHNPELFYRLKSSAREGRGWGADLGLEHQSNGSREPNSRSWNRVYFAPFIDYGPLRAELKLWRRLAEDAKTTPDDPTGDENPDIVDFYGYGELRLAYIHPSRQRAALMTRWNFATHKGALQLDYSLPSGTRNLFFYGQFWTGYGESLIDYNRSITRYGFGLLIRQ